MRFLTDEQGQRQRQANRRKADTPAARPIAYMYRNSDVKPSKRVKQQLMREKGISGKRARKLMKQMRRDRKDNDDRVYELPPRPIPPHTPGGGAA